MRLMTRMKCKLLEAEIKVLQFRILLGLAEHTLPVANRVLRTYRELLLLDQIHRAASNLGMN